VCACVRVCVCVNEPPAAMSRSRADFMSKPKNKILNDTSSGTDRSELDAKRRKNLAHVAC